MVKNPGLGGCTYCPLMRGFDLGLSLVFVHLGHCACVRLVVCWCWGVPSVFQVTLLSELLLLAWECSKKSPAPAQPPLFTPFYGLLAPSSCLLLSLPRQTPGLRPWLPSREGPTWSTGEAMTQLHSNHHNKCQCAGVYFLKIIINDHN